MPKKISEITIEKEVRRIKRDSAGKRSYEYLTYNLHYNPTVKNFSIRLFAKFFDLVFYAFIGIGIYYFTGRKLSDLYEIYALSFVLLLLLNPVLEHQFGKTVGKKFLKIQVIDDEGKYPNLRLSYKRNLLSFVNVIQLFRPIPGELGIKNNKHNEICNTYTIFDKDKPEIENKIKES